MESKLKVIFKIKFIKKVNFLHFVGIHGKNFLFKIIKSKQNVPNLIEQLIES